MLHFWDWYLQKYTSRVDNNSRTESRGKCISRWMCYMWTLLLVIQCS